jgi:hypothetical protein
MKRRLKPTKMKSYNVFTTDGVLKIQAANKKEARAKARMIIRNDNKLGGNKEKINTIVQLS